MRDLRTGDVVSDNRITFDDGILYIVSLTGGEGKVVRVILVALDDEPVTLTDISEGYPNVRIVIYETALSGEVYRYGNHPKEGELWERIGSTVGFA